MKKRNFDDIIIDFTEEPTLGFLDLLKNIFILLAQLVLIVILAVTITLLLLKHEASFKTENQSTHIVNIRD